MSEETVKVHIVKVDKYYRGSYEYETFDVRGFFSFQRAMDFVHELASDMGVSIDPDEAEFDVESTDVEFTSGYDGSKYYIDDVEVEQ